MLECYSGESGPARHIDSWPDVPGIRSWVTGRPLPNQPPEPIVMQWDPEETEGEAKHLYKAGIPLISHRLYRLLCEVGVDNLETFEAEVREIGSTEIVRFLAFNVVGVIAAADMEASSYDTGGGPPLVAVDFSSVVLDEPKIRGAALFRLAENVSAIVVHDRVKTHLEEVGLGLSFVNPEEWIG